MGMTITRQTWCGQRDADKPAQFGAWRCILACDSIIKWTAWIQCGVKCTRMKSRLFVGVRPYAVCSGAVAVTSERPYYYYHECCRVVIRIAPLFNQISNTVVNVAIRLFSVNRPPVEDIESFLNAESWMVHSIFEGKDLSKVAHGLAGINCHLYGAIHSFTHALTHSRQCVGRHFGQTRYNELEIWSMWWSRSACREISTYYAASSPITIGVGPTIHLFVCLSVCMKSVFIGLGVAYT